MNKLTTRRKWRPNFYLRKFRKNHMESFGNFRLANWC